MSNKLTLIICTRENKQKLLLSLSQLLPLLPATLSLLIVDQSATPAYRPAPHSKNIHLLHLPHQRGLGRARNAAIRVTHSEVLAWIDDDCLVTKAYMHTLQHLAKSTSPTTSPNLAGFTGQTLPYLPTKPSARAICQCTFPQQNSQSHPHPFSHWESIGLGNNMVIFRSTFEKVGGFKDWLGAGSFAEGGEDGEFFIRCLLAGYSFRYEKKLQIYHNKWLENAARQQQCRRYSCGGLALYGYFVFQGIRACQPNFKQELGWVTTRLKNSLRSMKKYPHRLPQYVVQNMWETYYAAKGLLVAYVHAKTSPLAHPIVLDATKHMNS